MNRENDMNNTYSGPDRRESENRVVLTDAQIDDLAEKAAKKAMQKLTEQIDAIAEKAAEKAMEKLTDHVYRQVGKGVIGKLFWIVGVSAVGVYLFLKSKGIIS